MALEICLVQVTLTSIIYDIYKIGRTHNTMCSNCIISQEIIFPDDAHFEIGRYVKKENYRILSLHPRIIL